MAPVGSPEFNRQRAASMHNLKRSMSKPDMMGRSPMAGVGGAATGVVVVRPERRGSADFSAIGGGGDGESGGGKGPARSISRSGSKRGLFRSFSKKDMAPSFDDMSGMEGMGGMGGMGGDMPPAFDYDPTADVAPLPDPFADGKGGKKGKKGKGGKRNSGGNTQIMPVAEVVRQEGGFGGEGKADEDSPPMFESGSGGGGKGAGATYGMGGRSESSDRPARPSRAAPSQPFHSDGGEGDLGDSSALDSSEGILC
jgi:hypothetical protein